jgi:hypothetical protein
MDWSTLPHALQKKKLVQLKEDLARGVPPHSLPEADRDLLHMENSAENLTYWRNENEVGTCDARFIYCQSIMRGMIVALRAREAPPSDEHPFAHMLEGVLEAADHLSPVH